MLFGAIVALLLLLLLPLLVTAVPAAAPALLLQLILLLQLLLSGDWELRISEISLIESFSSSLSVLQLFVIWVDSSQILEYIPPNCWMDGIYCSVYLYSYNFKF